VLRNLVFVLSITAIIVVAYLIATHRSFYRLGDIIQGLFFLGYPSLVLYYVITAKPPSEKPKIVNYLDLFFERRRLEEQAKIDKLRPDTK